MNVLELMIACLTLSAKFVIDVLHRFHQLDAVGSDNRVCLVIGFCYTELLNFPALIVVISSVVFFSNSMLPWCYFSFVCLIILMELVLW